MFEVYDRGADGIAENADDRSGKWRFLADQPTGVPKHLVAKSNMANPDTGVGDWQNLDLSQIDRWHILGDWGSTEPFDLSFDHLAISSTEVPEPYPGSSPNATWRTEAVTRIDANRKADFQITVNDATGRPLPGAQISVAMQKHEFGFGTAVQAFRLRDNHPSHAAYKQKTAEIFNEATIENNLKWEAWEGEWGSNFTQQGAIDAIAWLSSQDMRVRGHNLVWPGLGNLPQPVQNLLANPPLNATVQQAVRDAIAAHITDLAGRTGIQGALTDWDVINEPRANHDIMDAFDEGDLAMVHWFQQAKLADPSAKLYLNEYDIVPSGGATDTSSQQKLFDTLEYLINNGAPIDGIGLQSHFSPGTLTGPEELWQIFDRFDALGLVMKITEFDFATTDEQLQADYMRDFMTAVFAHEGLESFIQWGFWESAMWQSDGAMYRNDWSIKPNGQAFLDLVFGEWWTDADLVADLLGEAALRGFRGEYEITIAFGDETQTFPATLTEAGLTLSLSLDSAYAADFDQDRDVDHDDLLAWQNSYGLGPGGDANGDGQTNGTDFLIWQSQSGLPAITATSTTIPEPTTLGLATLVFLGSLLSRRIVYRE